MKSRYAADLAPEEVFDQANRILARDRAKLGSTNAPIYKGQTISPMSTLTQRARELQSGFNNRPAPYSGKINNVLGRQSQVAGGNILGALGKDQGDFNTNKLAEILQNQFGGAYNKNASNNRFTLKTNKDIGRGLNETQGSLGDIIRSANILERSSNKRLAQRLQGLQAQKQDRRKALVGNLEQFGAQRHAYNNLKNTINKNAFEQEANAPFKRMELLQNSIGPLSQSMGENVLPEIKAQAAKEALQALKAYGVDTNRPVNEWENARMGTASYPGKLIADLPPEILASGDTLEAISPKFKGEQYGQKKLLLNNLMANNNVGETALGNVPNRIRGQVENLESAAQKRFKRDLAMINNQFIQANQYGSPLHIKTAEDRARELSKSTLEQRSRLLEDAAKSELSLGHQEQQSKLKQLGMLGDQTQNEYQNLINTIRNTNQLGATKFANEQAENEDLYKNFQNEAGWEWPHLRGAISQEARRGALGEVLGGIGNRGFSLNDLADHNTRYSESQLDAKNKQLADLEKQLTTTKAGQADLQKRIAVYERQAAAQKRAQEAQAKADAQRRAEEAQRLSQQQAAAQAARDAEAQRLSALQAETAKNSTPAYYRDDLLTPEMRQAIYQRTVWNPQYGNHYTGSLNQGLPFLQANNFVPYRQDGQTYWRRATFDPRDHQALLNQIQNVTNNPAHSDYQWAKNRWDTGANTRLRYENGQWVV